MRIGEWGAACLSIYNNYTRDYHAMNKALYRISTGSRINSAADDAAGPIDLGSVKQQASRQKKLG